MKMKPWIIAGVSCLCAGTICCGAAVCAGALDQNRYRENLHLIDQTDTPSEAFTSVLMDVDNAEVTVQNGSKFSITAENVPQNSYHVAVDCRRPHAANPAEFRFRTVVQLHPFRISPVPCPCRKDHRHPARRIQSRCHCQPCRRLYHFWHSCQHPVCRSGLRRLSGEKCHCGKPDCG